MPSVTLPDDASLEQLRKQAKDVRDLGRAGVREALDLSVRLRPVVSQDIRMTRTRERATVSFVN
jgi:hypothetical protein